MGLNFHYLYPQIFLLWIVRTSLVSMRAPDLCGDSKNGRVSLGGTLKDSRCIQHMLSPAKSACFQPVLRKFSSNNDSSLWMITVLTQFFFFFLRLVKKLPGQGAIRCKTKLCSQQPTNILAFKAIFHYFFTKFDTSWHACLVSSFDSINANIFFCKFITS